MLFEGRSGSVPCLPPAYLSVARRPAPVQEFADGDKARCPTENQTRADSRRDGGNTVRGSRSADSGHVFHAGRANQPPAHCYRTPRSHNTNGLWTMESRARSCLVPPQVVRRAARRSGSTTASSWQRASADLRTIKKQQAFSSSIVPYNRAVQFAPVERYDPYALPTLPAGTVASPGFLPRLWRSAD